MNLVSFKHRPFHPWERSPRYLFRRRLPGHQSWPRLCGKVSTYCRESNYSSSAHSQSLYSLRYSASHICPIATQNSVRFDRMTEGSGQRERTAPDKQILNHTTKCHWIKTRFNHTRAHLNNLCNIPVTWNSQYHLWCDCTNVVWTSF
jgi:hypothetical protein